MNTIHAVQAGGAVINIIDKGLRSEINVEEIISKIEELNSKIIGDN